MENQIWKQTEPLKEDFISKAKELDSELFLSALNHAIEKVRNNLPQFTKKFPSAGGVNGEYQPTENADQFLYSDWTSSFWTGMVWLAYECTGEECFKETGLIHSKSFRERYEKNIILDHHDIGFLYTLSCQAAYELTGDQFSRETALLAAKKLAGRFQEKAGIVQRGGSLVDPNDPYFGVFIIDCMMNLPLLYWAAGQTGDMRYYEMAKRHSRNAAKYMVRPDGAVYQDYKMDVMTGKPLGGTTSQGDGRDEACWSRGAAWAIYGMSISGRYQKSDELLWAAAHVGHYFLNRLQSDWIPNWDLIYREDSDQRDTSAAAIAACGFLELAQQLAVMDPRREIYEAAAKVLVGGLIQSYFYTKEESRTALLKSGVYSFKTDLCVDEPVIWGDYFFMEALVRLTRHNRAFW